MAQASAVRAATAPAPVADAAPAPAPAPAADMSAAPQQATTASGGGASLAAETVAPAKTPLRTGGTVHNLLANWTGKGFRLLSTAPPAPVHGKSSHAGSVWDDARQTMWIFGAETHKYAMDNAVYGWRASDGLFVKHYDADPSSGYRMDAQGIYWSSAAKIRPWAMHTYRRMRMVPGTDEFEVVYDPHEHAYMTPLVYENPAHTTANRAPAMWYYNVVTGTWRHRSFGSSTKLVRASYTYPVGFDPVHGWFTGDGSTWKRLSPTGVYSTVSVSGKSNGQYHSYMFVKDGVAYRVGGNSSTTLYSRHPLSNITLSKKFYVADFPQLAGYTVNNMASAMMSDGRIVIFPTKGSETHAMILDPATNTLMTTGHFFTGMDKPTLYELAAEWSPSHNAVILLSRRFSASRVYAYRP
ncbi:hypothetical protein ACFSQU_00990 [Massilia sp. GCM10020059]|uniref:Uncharacterized protein n=1 Tax=Massilia agrisoli TaxID=2892444 RepID=A0ABS8IPW9_9BURK|nr:hypothetical protein [Massilia agrisoli]MCC6070657.1 hypothetical protein [Massilia agrisoli]